MISSIFLNLIERLRQDVNDLFLEASCISVGRRRLNFGE